MEYTEQQDASENRYTPLETLDPKELEGWTARELFFGSEQSDTDSSADSQTDTALSESDDFDPWALFFSDEITPGSDSDPVLDSRTETETDGNTGFSEQAFLSALQSDGESGTITNDPETEAQKPLTAQERLAMLGTALLDMGGMPSDQQLSAMGMDKPTARGIQSLVLLSKENSPTARRAVEAMIDATAPETQTEKLVSSESIDETALSEEKSAENDSAARILNNGHSVRDMAKIYADQVHSNNQWKWTECFPDANKLSNTDKNAIKAYAVEFGVIPNVPINKLCGPDGATYQYADFNAVGLVKKTLNLPVQFYFESDAVQFKWLDNEIGGRPTGYIWHHSEIKGRMELVPFGIHNVFFHHGGRAKNHWAYRKGER